MNFPDGTPWLLALLLMLFPGLPVAMSKVAAKLPGVLGVPARWWQDRKLRAADADRAARVTARLEALERDYADLKVAQEKQIDVLQAQIASQGDQLGAQATEIRALRDTVTKLDTDLTVTQRRFWDAVGYVRQLVDALRKHSDDIPDPPSSLRDIL